MTPRLRSSNSNIAQETDDTRTHVIDSNSSPSSSSFEVFGWSDFPLLGPSLQTQVDVQASSVLRNETKKKSSLLDRIVDRSTFTFGPTDVKEITSSEEQLPSSPTTRIRPSNKCSEKNVSFGTVEIREYSVILGDHTYPQDGLPLSLGWQYNVKGRKELIEKEHKTRLDQKCDTVACLLAQVCTCRSRRVQSRQGRVLSYKLSYSDRKERLMTVSSYSEADLLRQECDRIEQSIFGWEYDEDDDDEVYKQEEEFVDSVEEHSVHSGILSHSPTSANLFVISMDVGNDDQENEKSFF